MWETQLQICYRDYKLDNTTNLAMKVLNFISNISPECPMQIEGTEGQRNSLAWQSERWRRITASVCLQAYRVGQKVITGANNSALSAKKFISQNIWNIDCSHLQTMWMANGLESEADAINKYQLQTKNVVSPSGLWVNPKFPFLACSPDGLVGKDILLEIKSLKVFQNNAIDSIVNDDGKLISKETLGRQCFSIACNKCVLKKNHSYYFQVQLQLSITERTFCDFIRYAKNGPVSIERVDRDEYLMTDILTTLTALWKRVIAPELFEVRVPQDLEPFILPVDFISRDILPASSNNTDLPASPNNTDLPASPNNTDLPAALNNTDCSYSAYEVNIGNFLATCASSQPSLSPPIFELKGIPWGGTTSSGIKIVNTCPVDNWLMIFQSLVK